MGFFVCLFLWSCNFLFFFFMVGFKAELEPSFTFRQMSAFISLLNLFSKKCYIWQQLATNTFSWRDYEMLINLHYCKQSFLWLFWNSLNFTYTCAFRRLNFKIIPLLIVSVFQTEILILSTFCEKGSRCCPHWAVVLGID